MKQVSTYKDGKPTTVEVAKDQAGWKFPADFATLSNDKGKQFYVIPVTYTLLEASDVPTETVDKLKALGITDPIAEMNAGLKLAQGDLAKAPYRVKKAGATMQQIMSFLIGATDEQKATFKAFTDPTKAAEWVTEQLNG